MEKVRQVIAYQDYFENFLLQQTQKVQDKIFKIIELIETHERVPTKYLKAIVGTNGLFEVRVRFGNNAWRFFCFFDKEKLVILLNGFQKKSQKTPKREIERYLRLRSNYFKEKNTSK